MAVKKKKRSSKWIVVLGVLLLIVAVGGLVWKSYMSVQEFLFTDNQRFVVSSINVESPGWWNGKTDLVAQRFNISLEKTNIFSLDPALMRKTLANDPSIKHVSVVRELPDTISVKIEERIPRARLLTRDTKKVAGRNSAGKKVQAYDYKWVVDESGVVMSIDSCLDLSKGLPVIDYRKSMSKINKGMCVPKIAPALNLILLNIRKYHSFVIQEVMFVNEESLKFRISLRRNRKYTYIVEDMPYTDLDKYMKALKAAIIGEIKNRDPERLYKVRFDINGQVIWSR